MSTTDKLKQGYQAFQQKYFGDSPELYQKLRQGLNPATVILTCADSRVDPAHLFQSEPGQLFVIRNIANYVPSAINNDSGISEAAAAIEFALNSFDVRNLIVIGHQACSGVKGLSTQMASKYVSVSPQVWLHQMQKIKSDLTDEYSIQTREKFEKANVLAAHANLHTYDVVQDKIRHNNLQVLAGYFHLDTGLLEIYKTQTQKFESF